MYELKPAQEIDWQDMPKIEDPFFSRSIIEEYFAPGAGLTEQLWGIDEIIEMCVCDPGRRDEQTLQQVLAALKSERCFLLTPDPFSPLVRWQQDPADGTGGHWVKNGHFNQDSQLALDFLLARVSPHHSTPGQSKDKHSETPATGSAIAQDEPAGDTPVPLATSVEPPTIPVKTPVKTPLKNNDKPADYTVKPGDTLGAIATRYGLSWQALAQLNQLPDANRIFPGQTFKLPQNAIPQTVHTTDQLANDPLSLYHIFLLLCYVVSALACSGAFKLKSEWYDQTWVGGPSSAR